MSNHLYKVFLVGEILNEDLNPEVKLRLVKKFLDMPPEKDYSYLNKIVNPLNEKDCEFARSDKVKDKLSKISFIRNDWCYFIEVDNRKDGVVRYEIQNKTTGVCINFLKSKEDVVNKTFKDFSFKKTNLSEVNKFLEDNDKLIDFYYDLLIEKSFTEDELKYLDKRYNEDADALIQKLKNFLKK